MTQTSCPLCSLASTRQSRLFLLLSSSYGTCNLHHQSRACQNLWASRNTSRSCRTTRFLRQGSCTNNSNSSCSLFGYLLLKIVAYLLADTLEDSFRHRTFDLLLKAYISLPLPLASTYLGMSGPQIIAGNSYTFFYVWHVSITPSGWEEHLVLWSFHTDSVAQSEIECTWSDWAIIFQ